MVELAVEASNISKVFKGNVRALDGLSIQVEAGKIFAMLGPNGSGKTTLMRILTTQFKATSGRAYVFGLDVIREGKRIREMISYVPQEMSVWTDITGYENMLVFSKIYGIPSSQRKKMIDDALEEMNLTEFANKVVKIYSGGMIRRLEIASALLIKPRLLFLDEPTIGLDPAARKAVWDKVLAFKKEVGMTVFFNTHYMDEADAYADQITIISKGKEVANGEPDALKASVGAEIITVTIACPEPGARVVGSLKGLDGVSDVVVNEGTINIHVKAADRAIPGVIEILRSNDVVINKISTNKPSLDDVFLKYAGTRLESTTSIKDIKQTRKRIGGGG
ncbi:MAG: ATP-binding cassette domain-containing protein [Candidatus Sigynarchaeota archaeon]